MTAVGSAPCADTLEVLRKGGQMIQPTNRQPAIRPRHGMLVVGSVLATALVAYLAFGFIVGVIAFFVKLVVVVAVAALVVKLVIGRSRS